MDRETFTELLSIGNTAPSPWWSIPPFAPLPLPAIQDPPLHEIRRIVARRVREALAECEEEQG